MDVFPLFTTKNVGWGFTLNPASQIAQETRDNDAYAFTGIATANKAYTVNGLNQYTAVAGTGHSYDANGNLTGDGTNAYIYDGENRLVSATAARVTATLTYDPLGRLWRLQKGAADTRFLYDGDAVVAEYNAAGTLTQRYTHGSNMAADDPLIWYEGGATKRYLHADHLGSIVAATNAGISAPAINTYDEYGVPGAANVGRFQYTGQIWLSELGLYHYKARLYSPRLGRFLQTDPVGYKDQINLYAYVGDDPVNADDPSGLQALDYSAQYVAAYRDYAEMSRAGQDPVPVPDQIAAAQQQYHGPLIGSLFLPVGRVLGWAGRLLGVSRFTQPLAVIGPANKYVQLAEKLGARYFGLAPKEAATMSEGEIWQANRGWLDRQIEDRAAFRLAAPASEARAGSGFAKEIKYLKDHGYKLSKDGMTLRPGSRGDCTGTRLCG